MCFINLSHHYTIEIGSFVVYNITFCTAMLVCTCNQLDSFLHDKVSG